MMKKMLTSLGLFLVGGLVATAVSASTITIDQEHFATNPTVECEGCMGFYVPGYDPTAPDLTGLILDSEWATGFTGIGSTDSEELAGLNTLLGALSMAPVTDVKKRISSQTVPNSRRVVSISRSRRTAGSPIL